MYSSKRFDKLAMTRSAYGLRGRGAFEVEQQRPDDVDEEEPFERWAVSALHSGPAPHQATAG